MKTGNSMIYLSYNGEEDSGILLVQQEFVS